MKLDVIRALARGGDLDGMPAEVDIEGRFDEENQITYLGKAKRQLDGKYHVLANVRGQLCMVEVVLRRK